MILYEYPFNEKIRTYLRLEHLFARLFTLMDRTDAMDHHFALITLFEILNVGARAELKPDVLKDLDRQKQALSAFPEAMAFTVLDLGVGSGAILLAILAERPAAKGLGVDISEEALANARENAANLDLNNRVVLLRSDWTAGLDENTFDLVVSNPPYIETAVIATLDPEVREHDPLLALDGGPDGLEAYRTLAPQILRVLKPGAPFFVEIGADQKSAVEALFRDAGAQGVATIQDLSARDRVITGHKKPLGIPGGFG